MYAMFHALNLIRTSESEYSVEKSESDSYLNMNKWSRREEGMKKEWIKDEEKYMWAIVVVSEG
ncbi:hypothetical protein Tco_0290071, partial [Tanacetum coccineum]